MFSVLTKDFASFSPIVTRNFVLVTKFGLAGPSFLHPTQKYATIGQNSSHSERKRSFSMASSKAERLFICVMASVNASSLYILLRVFCIKFPLIT